MTEELRFTVGSRVGSVSALLDRPASARSLFVLGHGAGAGMHHPFMEAVASRLAERETATFRYQFPYMDVGRRRPDPPGILIGTVRAAVRFAAEACPDLPVIAGGKSMGGRMSSQAAAKDGLPEVDGLVYYGFPLHAIGRPSSDRAEHLYEVSLPMLFLQGTRDRLADLTLLRPVCQKLGARATLHVVEGADHSFRMLKRSGRTQDEVLDELAEVTTSWVEALFS